MLLAKDGLLNLATLRIELSGVAILALGKKATSNAIQCGGLQWVLLVQHGLPDSPTLIQQFHGLAEPSLLLETLCNVTQRRCVHGMVLAQRSFLQLPALLQ